MTPEIPFGPADFQIRLRTWVVVPLYLWSHGQLSMASSRARQGGTWEFFNGSWRLKDPNESLQQQTDHLARKQAWATRRPMPEEEAVRPSGPEGAHHLTPPFHVKQGGGFQQAKAPGPSIIQLKRQSTPLAIPPPKPLSPNAAQPQPFLRAQFVAFEICTMPQGFDTQHTTSDDRYLGQADREADVKRRLVVVEAALRHALADPAVDPDPETLKVFMAPEFLLRGPKGAYKASLVFEHIEHELEELTKRIAPPDWLCIFGTCLGYAQIPNATSFRAGPPSYEVYNFAPVIGAGDTAIGVLKKFKSGIDFLSSPTLGGLADRDVRHMLGGKTSTPPGMEDELLSFDTDGVFTAAGVTFGLEVCLDHAEGRLAATPGAASSVQIQLIPSGGMTVQPEAVCVKQRGAVFHCDGLTDAAGRSYGSHSSAYVKLAAGAAGGGGLHPMRPLSSKEALGSQWKALIKGIFVDNKGAPRVCVYPAVELPP